MPSRWQRGHLPTYREILGSNSFLNRSSTNPHVYNPWFTPYFWRHLFHDINSLFLSVLMVSFFGLCRSWGSTKEADHGKRVVWLHRFAIEIWPWATVGTGQAFSEAVVSMSDSGAEVHRAGSQERKMDTKWGRENKLRTTSTTWNHEDELKSVSVPAASDLDDKGILQKLEPFLREAKSCTRPRSQRGWGGPRREWGSWRPSCCFTLIK